MLILGIDPGLANTGWGVVDYNGKRCRPVSYGTVLTSANQKLEDRIAHIAASLGGLAKESKIEKVSMEEIFFAKNQISAINVAKVIGAICFQMSLLGIEVTMFTPLQIKMAITGFGRAEKMQVQEMTRVLLGLDKIPRPDHAADALAAAVCYANTSSTLGRLGL